MARQPKPAPKVIPPRARKVPHAKSNPAHRPCFKPTDEQRRTVEVMVAGGINQASICGVLKITEKTLRKHFQHELDSAFANINSIVVGEHIKRVKAGDMVAIKWWEQSRMGWSERLTLVDGGTEVDPNTLTDDELNQHLNRLRRSPAVIQAAKPGTVH